MSLRSTAVRLYSIVLRAFPRDIRNGYGPEMLDTFARVLDARVTHDGPLSASRYAVAAYSDALSAGLSARREALQVGFSWLDIKLGLRMLGRYPGLSVVGGLGIALIVVCGSIAGIFDSVINAQLPFPDAARIVAVENWDTTRNEPAPHDFGTWRDELHTLEQVGAYRLTTRNLSVAGQPAEPVRVADISASAFTIAQVPPLLGRFLLPSDERDSSPQVIVVGFDEWQRRFGADPTLVGRILQVGDVSATVVGVMPRGFRFPVNENYWMPLRLRLGEYAGGAAPSKMPYKYMPQGALHVFARLARGASLAGAQAEAEVAAGRLAAASPATHEHVHPRVLPYTTWFFLEQHDGEIYLVRALLGLLLAVVGSNVAVLVYARTATRRIEIALRGALGASRGRIVGQMFAEGLVLSSVAAGVGWFAAAVLRNELAPLIPWQLAPFWVDTRVTSGTVLTYVVALALLGGVVVGAIPAIQATGKRAQAGLQQAASQTSGWRIGRTYGALVIVQVMIAVAILPYALSSAWTSAREATTDPGPAAHEYLVARLGIDGADLPRGTDASAYLGARRADLTQRLEREPDVAGVTFLAQVPGAEPTQSIKVENGPSSDVGIARVPDDYLQAFEIPLLAGRQFSRSDEGTAHVIVNRTFADKLAGGNPIGRRLRQESPDDRRPGPWLDIVGVAEDFPATAQGSTHAQAKVYFVAPPDSPDANVVAVRVRNSAPIEFAPRLRAIATAVDRRVLLRDVNSLDGEIRAQQIAARIGAWASSLATLCLLLLSATGLYALMSFTVTQRRREIGIRVALGADATAIVRSILSRAMWQLSAGVVLGTLAAAIINSGTADEFTGGAGLQILPLVAAFVLSIGLAAAIVPVRRGLEIEPTEAMRAQ